MAVFDRVRYAKGTKLFILDIHIGTAGGLSKWAPKSHAHDIVSD